MSAEGGDSGAESFARLIGKVRRLQHDTVEHERPRPPALPRGRRRDAPPPPLTPLAPADSAWPEISPDHAAEYQRAGVQRSVLRKLRRGHYLVQDELDLHGLNVREAGVRLAAFLDHARGRRLSCIRVIHGKGLSSPGARPVLKPQVARWLRQHDAVLAFTPARAEDGGSGATYVLLRSRRE